MSQKQAILNDLMRGEVLTPWTALQRHNCMRLAARIWELKVEGHAIKAEIKTTRTGKNIAEYRLETQPRLL